MVKISYVFLSIKCASFCYVQLLQHCISQLVSVNFFLICHGETCGCAIKLWRHRSLWLSAQQMDLWIVTLSNQIEAATKETYPLRNCHNESYLCTFVWQKGQEWEQASEWVVVKWMNTLSMLINVRPFLCLLFASGENHTHSRKHPYKDVYYTFDCRKIMRKQTQCITNEASFWWSQRKTRAFLVKENWLIHKLILHTFALKHVQTSIQSTCSYVCITRCHNPIEI